LKNLDMNRDDQLEQRLRRQPVKRIPSEWREQILTQAASGQPAPNENHVSRFTFHALWQKLIWPNPNAWAGLAAVWLVILGLNFASRDSAPRGAARPVAAPDSEMRRLLLQQELLYAQLMDLPLPPVAEPRKPVAPGPHSRRRVEFITA
jgi:hypothetical protein